MAGPLARRSTAALVLLGPAVLVLRAMLPASDLPWLPGRELALALAALALAAAWRLRRQPAEAPLERDPGLFVLLGALAALFATLVSHGFRLTSDGVDHFVYLRSLWIDGDLDLANDFARLSPRGAAVEPLTPLGRTGNLHPVGPALVWSPFYLLADLASRLTGRAPDGENALYRNAVSAASLLYGWSGLLLVYLACRARCGRGPALLASLGLGFGTFLYWYLAWAPTMAHAPAFGAAALVVWLWLRPGGASAARALALGAACGLCALVRWGNGLLILLPLLDLLPRLLRRAERLAAARDAALAAGAALVVFAPQAIVWKLLYGSFLALPQGTAFLAGSAEWAGVLFSPRHGLLSWSPLVYLGAAGLLAFARREPWRAASAAVFALALTRLNAGVADWWGGAAFGARRFDALLPILGLGLAFAVRELGRFGARYPLLLPSGIVASFLGFNLLLAQQYRSGVFDYSEPVSFEDMGRGAVSAIDRAIGSPFSLPASLLEWLRSGRSPADWESLYMQRLHARWSVRMGLDERLFLDDGWSGPREVEGESARLIAGGSAGLAVPLHRPAPYRLGVRVRGPQGTALSVLLNQRPVGRFELDGAWADQVVEVAPELLRPGRNLIRLRAPEPGSVAVAGVWLEPAPE